MTREESFPAPIHRQYSRVTRSRDPEVMVKKPRKSSTLRSLRQSEVNS